MKRWGIQLARPGSLTATQRHEVVADRMKIVDGTLIFENEAGALQVAFAQHAWVSVMEENP